MIKKLYTSNYNEQLALCHILCTSALLPFSARKICIISTWSGFAIYLFRIIPPALALLYGNCPLAFKLRSYFAPLQKLSSEVFCKINARGHLCCSLVLIKLGAWDLAVLLKQGSSARFFPLWFAKFLRASILKSICQRQFMFL